MVSPQHYGGLALFALALASYCRADSDFPQSVWHEDYSEAEATARESDKVLLLFFTGSDWCIWCQKLEREAFRETALSGSLASDAVPLRIDFPQSRALPPKRQRANAILKEAWNVDAVPSVILYDPVSKKELWRHGYVQLSADDYIDRIRRAVVFERGLDKPLNGQ